VQNEPQPFDRELFESLVHARDLELGRSLLSYETTTSTNDVVLRALSEGAPHGLVVVADQQTAGRGRRGRTWVSTQAGENLLFTVLLRPEQCASSVSSVTLAIGLAMRDALEPHVDDEIRIKWTNDLLVDNRKLAGILVESQLRSAELSLAVGIGLNVHLLEPPPELRLAATSLRLLGARELRREFLLADILKHVALRLHNWEARGFSSMLEDFRACDALRGHRVTVDGLAGRAMGIDESGALLLQVDHEPAPRVIINGTVDILD
jgi:BirA family transcriptional regulator, biotin operon repressor / biotin---[acetyl-CoA-carboxylase] ligase